MFGKLGLSTIKEKKMSEEKSAERVAGLAAALQEAKSLPGAVMQEAEKPKQEAQYLAVASENPSTVPAGYKVKRALDPLDNGQLFLATEGAEASFVIDAPFVERKKGEKAKIWTVRVTLLGDAKPERGAVLVVPPKVRSAIEQSYSEASYVGRAFYVRNLGKKSPDARGCDFEVLELEPS